MCVYLTFTNKPLLGCTFVEVYKQGSYQQAYNWLADIAEQVSAGYPQQGFGNIVLSVHDKKTGQCWWVEKHKPI
jgi:hypothetical protein